MLHPSADANKSILAETSAVGGVVRRYRIYGQTIASQRELPGLPRADDMAEPADVTLHWEKVPERLAETKVHGACFQAAPGEFLIWREGVAHFHVRGGNAVAIEVDAGASAEKVVQLLLSAPWAARSLLAGLLPLHASAVAMREGAVVFLGGASAGKSEVAAASHARGFGVLADDLTVLRVDTGQVTVAPGLPRVQRWPATNGEARGVLDCSAHASTSALPLAAIYVLDRGAARAPARLAGPEAIAALLDGVYRPAFVRGLGLERQVLAQAAALAKSARVRRLVVPDGGDPRDIVARVVEDLAS